ncbi:hypothetical protein [Absidia glauca]|uniref:PH domain-containing protein n=1 Tax=Absidia glauca TaxID=4829 RepID=A0A168RWT2_ABSGL|nr:hypothetical protein [Absidia glauca]
MTSTIAEGWLFKHGSLGLVHTRHARYCILTDNELKYYKHKTDQRPNGILDLKHYIIAEKDTGKHHPYGFRIVSHCKQHRSYLFYADNEKECLYWIDIINNCLNSYDKRYDTCNAATLLPPMDEPYSVLDKWLNRLDLSDDQSTQQQQQSTTRITSPPPLVHSSATPSTTSVITTSTNIHSLHLPPHHLHTSPTSYCTSSTKSPTRVSTDSLDSLPSETTLSSSAGSRAYMSHNTLFTPTGNLSKTVSKAPTTAFNKRHSNPITFVSRSLSNLKNEHTKPPRQPQSPSLSFDSMTLASDSKARKEWEMDDLFHFDDLVPSYKDAAGDTHTPPLSHGF